VGRTTLKSEVEAGLRAAILAGQFEPGQRLKLAEVSAAYGVSLPVVREALARLSAQGLVFAEPQLGFRVTELSPSDLEDLTRVRIDIETLVLRRALAEADVAWEGRVIAAHHALSRAATGAAADIRTDDRWATAHAAFHNAIIGGCDSLRLQEIASSLRESAELYQRWSHPLDSTRDVAAEHLALLEAVLDRDETRAVQLLTQHIQRTSDVLLTTLVHSDADYVEPSQRAL
jgi:DNA-binding GntR family transcriptional regulator